MKFLQIMSSDSSTSTTVQSTMMMMMMESARNTFLRNGLMPLLVIFLLVTTCSVAVASEEEQPPPPLKVFILAGQSNMEGKGSTTHLQQLLRNNLTKATYQHLWSDGGGTTKEHWTQRRDVMIYFNEVGYGNLTVGYGMSAGDHFGPELEFGNVVGDFYDGDDESILLIKIAWGGKDLAIDFRPPSRGVSNYTHCNDTACYPYHPMEYGYYYREMMRTIKNILSGLSQLNAHYAGRDYILEGFVWFQGFNDVFDRRKNAEYEVNLRHFVHDIRLDLETPNLPIVIGELGMAGIVPQSQFPRDLHLNLRRAQRTVAMETANCTYVMTSAFVVANGATFEGDYHYYGRADTFFLIGRAFGQAMLQLLEDGGGGDGVNNFNDNKDKDTIFFLLAGLLKTDQLKKNEEET